MNTRPLIAVGLIATLLLLACSQPVEPPKDVLTRIKEDGKLIVLTRNGQTTYYKGREVWEGFEYELAGAFAEYLGVDIEFRVMDTTAELLDAIAKNEGHFAAAGLTRTPMRMALHQFGPDYQTVQQQVVCRRGRPAPRSIEGLAGRSILVVGGTSYEERLVELSREHSSLTWTANYNLETEQILEMVWRGEVDCTVADSNIIAINRRYLPELIPSVPVSESQSLAWVLAPEYAELGPIMDQWLLKMTLSWELDQLKERYYGYVRAFDYVDIKRFHRRITQRLPTFEADFKIAATRYGFDWSLLAAQAYQESHWDVTARSPTGVRGIMMLTQRTAQQVGVVDRLNPKESIMGGAKYLAGLYERLPEDVVEPDRTWMALAAYNVGFGHLMDARQLAEEDGLNPNLWSSLRTVLPKLSKREYYKRVRYGYARGREPVRYVQRIRNFHNILARTLAKEEEILVEEPQGEPIDQP